MSKMLFSAKDIIGLLILVSGVLVGVLLLQQNTEYREKAANGRIRDVLICHLESREDNLWIQVRVQEENLKKHIDHGDILGECPMPESAFEE